MEAAKGGRLIITGSGSGCGKTTAVCAVLYGLKKRGFHIEAWKCGPDYIDPMFHKRAIGVSTGNLDLFFSGREKVRTLLAERGKNADISIIEGAMGYYDGIGMTREASAWELALVTDTPAVLVVNPRGMGSSVLALVQGFLTFQTPSHIAGILFNRVSKERYALLKEETEKLGIKVLGYIPEQTVFTLESRHLGLVTAEEIEAFTEKLEKLDLLLQDTVDWQELLITAQTAGKLQTLQETEDAAKKQQDNSGYGQGLTIGVARDEAFCFLYEDNLRYLESRGCRLVFFSPLREKRLPAQIDGILLCGGYPELFSERLSQNTQMRTAIKEAIEAGMPCIAECGGFLYLQKTLEDMNGVCHEMAGVLEGNGFRRKKLEQFGYITAEAEGLFGKERLFLRAHEFHYFDCDRRGESLAVQKASGRGSWKTGMTGKTLYAGFPHIYFYGNEAFADAFLEQAEHYGKGRSRV